MNILNMKNKLLLSCFMLVFCNICLSQINFTRDTSIRVYENNVKLQNAWNGGINSAQFSNIDLNLDGIKDLIVFDRSGNKLSTYLNINGDFIFAPEYRDKFPNIENWILMEDYNCDGMNDIFTYSNAGISVYMNTSSSTLSFSLASTQLISSTSSLGIYVSPMDLPAISDIDYDGDLDILTFEITGGFVHYFKNQSIENYGHCDSLEYEHDHGCWGNFYEGLNTYILNCTNCICPPITLTPSNRIGKHAGSSLIAIDVDGDNDKDLILGDISYNNLNLLINGGDNQNANIVSVDTAFPSNTNNTAPVNIHLFPSAFYVDVTNDGNKDLIVTTNMQNNSANYLSCWLYENTSNNSNPDFNFIKKDFIQSSGIDLGEGAYPAFYDYNNDGLLDLFIGNYGYHNITGTPNSKIAYYQNIGTLQDPEYSLITDDFGNISSINLNTNLNAPALNLHPTFGDMNGDNLKDLVIGDADGKVHLFINNSGNFVVTAPNLSNIDVGYFASPQIIDVNRDGLNDLIIGSKKGTIYYFENKGSLSNPDFSTAYTNWGDIDVDSSYISNGFSTPKLVDINGDYHLFIGSYSGKTYLYNNIDGNINGTFNYINSIDNSVWEGGRTSIAVADINNDNLIDIIIGNQCGGISYFKGDSNVTTQSNNESLESFHIFPNPSTNTLYIKNSENQYYKLFNIYGEVIMISNKNKINIGNLSKGVYFINLNRKTYKFIKQ